MGIWDHVCFVYPQICMTPCCNRQGVNLIRAEYIPDDKDDIGQTVLRLKERVGPDGVIFSSGGIGPTHDDVTYEALASAFGGPCHNAFMQAQYALPLDKPDTRLETYVPFADASHMDHNLRT